MSLMQLNSILVPSESFDTDLQYGTQMKVHISIDDVGKSFRWLARERPESIFDTRLFGKLRQWNNDFGAKFTLYVFALTEKFLISEIPSKYAEDFRGNADWLKFGYHGKCEIPFAQESGYAEGFDLVDKTFTMLNAGKTNILRLHCWLATKTQKMFLSRHGTSTLLYPDDNNMPYGNDNTFYDDDILHRRTQVCYERITVVDTESLCVGDKYVSAFTHEWCFDQEAEKIKDSLKIYRSNGYEFIA